MGLNMALTKFLFSKRAAYGYGGRVLTLGKQEIAVTTAEIKALGGAVTQVSHQTATDGEYLKALGFATIDSMDVSAHDGATILHNLNEPVSAALWDLFDCVIDGGTLEHCFNVSACMESVLRMLKSGGSVIHINPTAGSSNHGFYNFQPTFYFSFYGANGFGSMDCHFIEMHTDPRSIFTDKDARVRVVPVENWNNLDYHTAHPSYVIFRAVKGSREPEPPVVPIQEFYYRIFREKQKVGGGRIDDAIYRRIRGDVGENDYQRIMGKSYWL